MSAFESSVESLLQGVSQQNPANRKSGQVQAQLNMQSDPVTGPRRRAGLKYLYTLVCPSMQHKDLRMFYAEMSGTPTHFVLDCRTGQLWYMDDPSDGNAEQKWFKTYPYLITDDSSTIRFAVVQDKLYILNTKEKPTLFSAGTDAAANAKQGAFRVQAGAFDTLYQVEVEVRNAAGVISNGSPYTASYTTPKATEADAALHSSPRYIAEQLQIIIDGWIGVDTYRSDGSSTVFIDATGVGPGYSISIRSSVGYTLLTTSGSRHYLSTSELPAGLPVEADGWAVAVGSLSAPQYYKWDSAKAAWIETAAAGSPTSILNVPIQLYRDGSGMLTEDVVSWPGRLAGDDTTNPAHNWMTRGITGMGSYQGRLVLLSDSYVSMSSSADPTRFWRSTVTAVVDSDPIEVGASSENAAAYEHCLTYQHDLLLFSKTQQALVPSNNQAVSPRTAMVVPTGQYSMDLKSAPLQVGRTVMAPLRRSSEHFGVLEIVPNPMTDQQYLTVDVTQHIPRYLPGHCRFSSASSVAGTVIFAPSAAEDSLIVHEYFWDGDQKLQQAWSTWTFPYPVAAAYFVRDSIFLAFVDNSTLVVCQMDTRGRQTGEQYFPFLDIHGRVVASGGKLRVPAFLRSLDPTVVPKVRVAIADGPRAGDQVKVTQDPDDWRDLKLARGFPDGQYIMGIPYRSSLTPSQVVIRDNRDQVISTSKLTILRYVVGTSGSSEFKVSVSDSAGADDLQQGTLTWSSRELALGAARKAGQSYVVVPVRHRSDSGNIEIFTEGTGELCLTSLEYVGRYNQKIRRR